MDEQSKQPNTGYSKAYEVFVEEPGDIVGLLAYALYKRSINERKTNGSDVLVGAQRNPHAHEIETYKSVAENYLRTFAQSAIKEETPNILRKGVKEEIEKIDLILNGWSPYWIGTLTGVVAWFLSLVITIVIALSVPDWVNHLVSHIQGK